MSLELAALGAITPWLGEWITVKIAERVLGGVNSQLQASDLDKALKICISTADRQVKLFYSCEPRFIPKLLERVLKDVAEELQRPLKNEGTPQLDYLVKAFEIALEEHPKIKQDINIPLIEPWLEVFAKTYFEKTHSYLKLQIAKKDYLKQLANYFDDVKFAGFAIEGQEVDKSAHLAQIFVTPDVVEDFHTKELLSFDSMFINSRHKINLGDISQFTERDNKKFSAQKLLTESRTNKFVLLGQPGSGKTSLISYFAVMLAERQHQQLGLAADTELLPIIIKIRDLVRYTDISILEYIQQFSQNNLCVKQLPSGFFEYWLDYGQALILLDGLDEVADPAKRNKIVVKIDCFLEQFDKNRAIITSRPAGYRRDFFRTEEFPHYTLQLFDDVKIELFIHQWYASRFKDPAEAQRRCESLTKALREQEKIRILAQNPLLLTLVTLIHRYEAHLPRQRYKLYDRAVKTLLTAWDASKEIDYKSPLEYLNQDDIERLMQQLAYWIHTQGGTGNQNGGTLIDKDELITQLSKFIAEQKRIERHQAKAEAKRFLDYIRERSGLLNEQGQDCYAFVHKTFQEYLAAEDIRYRQEDDGFEVVLEHIQKYLHDAHWREVLLLLIAQQKPKKSTKVLEAILQRDTPYEQWLHRNLFFAGSCLAEDIEVSDDKLVKDLLQRLLTLEVSGLKRVGRKISLQVFETFSSLYQTRLQAQVLQFLKESSDQMSDVRLQKYCAAMGEQEKVIAILLVQLQDEDSEVRAKAARTLGILDNNSEKVMQALLARLEDEDSRVRREVSLSLRMLDNNSESEKVIQRLLARLEDENSDVRNSCASVLGKLGNNSEAVMQALLARLEDEDSWVRCSAALALGKLGNNSEVAMQTILAQLEDEYSGMHVHCIWVLEKLGNNSEAVMQALLARLEDEDSWVRVRAACGLLKLGNDSDLVMPVLMAGLEDNNSIARYLAVEQLIELGKPSHEILPTVTPWISQCQNSENFFYEIDTLWTLVLGE